MAMAVLRSQGCLGGRFRDESLGLSSFGSRRKPPSPIRSPGPNPNPNPNHNANDSQFRRRKRSTVGFRSPPQGRDRGRSRVGAMVEKAPGNNLVMGEVKILKRGEKLRSDRGIGAAAGESGSRNPRVEKAKDDVDLVLGSTNRLGPDPETVKKQVRLLNSKAPAATTAVGIYAGSGAFSFSPPPSSLPLPAFLVKNGAATTDLRRLLQLA